jgi:hypothetical protein
MKAEAFDEIHGFDEQLAVGFGDVDLCLRAGEKGWRILYCAMAHLVHHESLTRGINNLHPEDTALFLTRWKEFIEAGDPYYNPNLSLTSTRWDFANPLPTNVKLSTRVHQKKSHLSDTEFPHPV